jgi:membrane-associated phospholipid phosphatase
MKKLFFIIIILTSGFCFGQLRIISQKNNLTGEPGHSGFSFSDDISSSVHCIGDVLTAPLQWGSNDLIMSGIVITGVAGSFLLDDEIRNLVLKNKSSFNENVLERTGHLYSTVLYVGPAALIFYLSGAVFEDRWVRTTGQMLVEAVIITGIVQIPVGITTGRARPFFNEGNNSFKLFAGTDDNRASFFSGHSMIAFSFSTILAGQIDNTWASIGLYTLASLGPFSRLYKDKHWFSDSILGSALGVFAGKSILNWHRKNDDISGEEFNIIPLPGGVSITWKF